MFHCPRTVPQPRNDHHTARPAPPSPRFQFSVFPKTGNPAGTGRPDFENISPSFGRLGRGRGPRPMCRERCPPAEKSLNRPGSQKKREKFRIFFRFSGRNKRGSRTHSTRVPLPHLSARDRCRPPTPHSCRPRTARRTPGRHRPASARTCAVRGTHPPFLTVPTRQRGNAVKDAPASVFSRRHGMLALHPRLPGRLSRARGPALARVDHGLRCRRRGGGAGAGEAWLAAACGRSLRSAW